MVNPSPGDDRDTPFGFMFFGRELGNAVFPEDIHIAGKGVGCSGGEGEGNHFLGVIFFEGDIAGEAETDADGEILGAGFIGFNGGGIVMKWLPFGRAFKPVKAGGLNPHPEIILNTVDDKLKGGALFFPACFIIGDIVSITVPEFQEAFFGDATIFHFIYEAVVEVRFGE